MQENSLLDFLQDVRHPPKQILLGPTRAHGRCEMFLSAVTMSVCRASAFLPHLSFLSDVQNQLELLRHGQVLLRRLLRIGHRRRYLNRPARRQRLASKAQDRGRHSPRAPRFRARCSTESSSPWQQCIMGETNRFI